MAEVRIIDYAEIEKGREEDKIVYDQMATQVNSAICKGTTDSRLITQGSFPFKHYEIRQVKDPSQDNPLVSIGARFQDPRDELSGLVVDVMIYQGRFFDNIKGPISDASRQFRQVHKINLIQKYKRND